MNESIKRACEIIGGQTALAVELRIAQSNVAFWINGDRPIPVQHCPAIERLTNGSVTRKELRPNDWQLIWPELAEKAPA